ncbi:MAG: response regulator transcription factor [Polyangiales bacterium]
MPSDSHPKPVTVAVVDDQTIFREMLVELLAADERYRVVGQYRTANEALEKLRILLPDVVVLDVMLPDRSGIDVLRELAILRPAPRILVVTAYEQPTIVRDALEAGAHGMVTKGAPLRELRAAIERVAEGGAYYCSTTSEILRRNAQSPPEDEALTARERQIVRMVASGASSKEIAAELGISEKTVQNHRMNIMNKLGIRDVAGLTRFAIARGLIAADV